MSQPRQSLSRVQRDISPIQFAELTNQLWQSGLFSSPRHDTIHTLFAPMHYEPGYSYPLLVWLHGAGCDERQLLRIMPLVSMRNYVAVAPRGTTTSSRGAAALTRAAATLSPPAVPAEQRCEASFGWSHDDEELQEAEQRIFDSLESTFRRFNIDSRRVFLAGFDCGGTMAFRVAMNHPYKFAGVLSLGGCLPTGGAPLSRLAEARQLAVFLAAGRRSKVYGEQHVCDDLRLLHTAGMSVTLRLYPCGHEISPQMLSDVDRWIIEQITASKARADGAAV